MVHLINQFKVVDIKDFALSFVSPYYQRQLLALSAAPLAAPTSSSTLFQPNPADACYSLPVELLGIHERYKRKDDQEPSGMTSQKVMERLIRRVAFEGDSESLQTILTHPLRPIMSVDLNAKMPTGSEWTALHAVIIQANSSPDEKQAMYQACYELLLETGEVSLTMVDKHSKTAIDYDKKGLFPQEKAIAVTPV